MSMENHGGMISTEETDVSTRALWQSYQQRHLIEKQEKLAREMINLAFQVTLFIVRSDFYMS
jgi:hypothetical protein